MGPRRTRQIVLVVALVLTLLSGLQAVRRAQAGRSALVKWRPQIERMWSGAPIYGAQVEDGREGFPTPPITAIALTAFLAPGDLVGALLWAAFKLGLAWWCVLAALRLAAGRPRDFPPWGALLVAALCWRVMASDIAHGNINLPLAAMLVAAAVDWRAGRDLRCGLWIGLAASLKVTPLLFALYFLRKRGARALGGLSLGLALGLVLLPALFLGWSHNLELLGAWWRQMVAPYLAGAPLGVMQTEHINQSLLGVLARLFSPGIAIPADPPSYPADVYVNVLSLSPEALRWLHRAAAAAVLAALLWFTRAPRGERDGPRVLGEWSLVTLAMLMLSERSWKQHYVILVLPLAYLVWRAWADTAGTRSARLARAALWVAAFAVALSGSAILGDRGSDLAEAWGVFLWGALALFVACGRLLGRADALRASA